MVKKLECGAAGVRIELSGGKVTVYHSEGDSILYQADVYEGYWNNLWDKGILKMAVKK